MLTQTDTILTDSERALFADCEQMIQGAIIYQGKALRMILEGRLWRDDYQSFDHYTRSKWGWTSQYCYQLIQHYDTYITTGAELTKHAHYRQLEKASYGTIRLIADLIPKLEKINAKAIAILVDVVQTAIATGTIEVSEGEQLRLNQITALQAAMLLEQIETRKRQMEHLGGSKPTPVATYKGRIMDYLGNGIRTALAVDPDREVSNLIVYKNEKGFTIKGEW